MCRTSHVMAPSNFATIECRAFLKRDDRAPDGSTPERMSWGRICALAFGLRERFHSSTTCLPPRSGASDRLRFARQGCLSTSAFQRITPGSNRYFPAALHNERLRNLLVAPTPDETHETQDVDCCFDCFDTAATCSTCSEIRRDCKGRANWHRECLDQELHKAQRERHFELMGCFGGKTACSLCCPSPIVELFVV